MSIDLTSAAANSIDAASKDSINDNFANELTIFNNSHTHQHDKDQSDVQCNNEINSCTSIVESAENRKSNGDTTKTTMSTTTATITTTTATITTETILENTPSTSSSFQRKKHKRKDKPKAGARKRLRLQNSWIDVQSKKARNAGVSGEGRKGVEIKERKMGDGCGDKCRFKCEKKISKECRTSAFNQFWNLQD